MAVNFATISICLILFWIVLSVLRKKLARISFKDRVNGSQKKKLFFNYTWNSSSRNSQLQSVYNSSAIRPLQLFECVYARMHCEGGGNQPNPLSLWVSTKKK